MRRPTALTLAALVAAGFALTAHPAAAAPVVAPVAVPVAAPAPPPTPVNLIANGNFEADDAMASWHCDGTVYPARAGGSSFIQVAPRGDEEPPPTPTPAPDPTPPTPPVAKALALGSPGGTRPGINPPPWSTAIVGTPDPSRAATCSQIVPVRPRSTYTLTARVRGGLVFLGSDYGVNWSAGSADYTTLTTSFRTPAGADKIRVYIHGWFGGEPYTADDITLTGPDSRTRSPIAPTHVAADLYTSRALALRWNGSPGATSYRVYQDGALIRTMTGTWLPVYHLTGGHLYKFRVEAVNSAGRSPRSEPLETESAPAYPTPPLAPTDVSYGADVDEIGLIWTAPATATDGYYVYVNGSLAGWVVNRYGLLRGIAPGTYTLEVSALNSAGESPESAPVTMVVDG